MQWLCIFWMVAFCHILWLSFFQRWLSNYSTVALLQYTARWLLTIEKTRRFQAAFLSFQWWLLGIRYFGEFFSFPSFSIVAFLSFQWWLFVLTITQSSIFSSILSMVALLQYSPWWLYCNTLYGGFLPYFVAFLFSTVALLQYSQWWLFK